MSMSFVLISVEPMHGHEVFNILSKLHEIIEVYELFGEYDLLIKIEADDFNKIGDIIINKIRSIKGVINTKTLNSTQF